MKQTGVTRKIDELGRIVIPKEIRKNLGIRDGESLEIFTSDDSIILKKYYEVRRYEDLSSKLCELIKNIYNVDLVITDREKIITSSNKDIVENSKLNNKFLEFIDNREMFITKELSTINLGVDISGYFTIIPIIASSDSLGLVIIISDKLNDYSSLGKLLAKIISDKIDIF
ncbi:transcriptional regulator AbrB family [Clostridium sp. CAG:609]|nr:transcriptional regulator AbrB family [Clostridium sp. CAG:609]